jgi:hypothetical protein
VKCVDLTPYVSCEMCRPDPVRFLTPYVSKMRDGG